MVEYQTVRILYLWEGKRCTNKISRFLLLYDNLRRFLRCLDRADIVYTSGISSITRFFLVARFCFPRLKPMRLVAEKTEHISVPIGGRLASLSQRSMIRLSRKLDGLIVISEPLRRLFIEYGIDSNRIQIVNMTVNPLRFEGVRKEVSPVRYIAYCGNASNNKDGVDQLLKAFSIVVKHIPDVKLYIIGKPLCRDDESHNLELIHALGIEESVHFTGIVSADLIPQILKNAEVLVLDRPDSIQAQYGFPTKLGEYLLTGNPVVVTKVGDIPKFLEDGVSALLAEERNPEDFAKKVEWALTHVSEASAIGVRGTAVAMEHFNCVSETRKLLNFLLRL